MRATPLDRLKSRIVTVPESGCWIYNSGDLSDYGRIRVRGVKVKAHRLSYEAHHGPVPSGLFVCHRCDTPSCVNPDHLYAGTASQNSIDRNVRGRNHDTRGEMNGASKLTLSDVLIIRSSEDSQAALAKRFAVCFSLISAIRSGKAWAWAPGRVTASRKRRTESHCANGHDWVEKNIWVDKRTGRESCCVCRSISAAKRNSKGPV